MNERSFLPSSLPIQKLHKLNTQKTLAVLSQYLVARKHWPQNRVIDL
jgi:hypothetical protein